MHVLPPIRSRGSMTTLEQYLPFLPVCYHGGCVVATAAKRASSSDRGCKKQPSVQSQNLKHSKTGFKATRGKRTCHRGSATGSLDDQ
jgi:hypothetical protein